MCPVNGANKYALNGTIQCSLEMGLANVLYEWDYPMCPGNGASHMCPGNGTSQCTLGMGLAISPGNGTIQCALGLGLTNVHWEGDYPMCPGNGTSQCTQ